MSNVFSEDKIKYPDIIKNSGTATKVRLVDI